MRRRLVTTNDINPEHYKATIDGKEIQVADVIEAFFLTDAHLSQACKYLLRAGKKPDSSYIKDVGKALWWCARAILWNGGTIDLPPQASYETITIAGKTPLSPKTTRTRTKKQ
jgi:Protein of unknwon function (DUF3310)